MKMVAIGVLIGAMTVGTSAFANADLVKQKQCMQCHAIHEDGAGPSFKKIATYWKGTKNAEKTLVATIRKGSGEPGMSHWGTARMPDDSERPLVSEAEAKKMAKWILSQ